MQTYLLANPKADTLAEAKGKTLYPDTSDIKAKALPHTLGDTYADICETIGKVKSKALNTLLADTAPKKR